MSSKQIHLVDDDITSLDIVAMLFERKGFEVSRSTSGAQTLEFINQLGLVSEDTESKLKSPDILVVDIMMPGIDGIETVKMLRDMGHTMPVIAFTASDDPALHERAKNAGCERVLTKPCKSTMLIEAIECEIAKKG